MHIDLLETQALPRLTRSGTREVPGRHKSQPLHTGPAPTASTGARLHKVRFEIQAQDTQQQATAGFSPLKYQPLTIPTRQKGEQAQGKLWAGTRHSPYISSPPLHLVVADPYISSQGITPTEIIVPTRESVAGGQEVNGAVWGLLNEPTMHLRTPASREKKQGDLLDIPRFIGYTVGAVAVLGLYLIIPLMILLNALLPRTWNRLFVALGILAVGEILICTVLAKTIPKGTRHVVQENRGDVLVQL